MNLLAGNKQPSLLDQEETYAITSGRHVSTDQNQWLYCMGKPQTKSNRTLHAQYIDRSAERVQHEGSSRKLVTFFFFFQFLKFQSWDLVVSLQIPTPSN